METGVSIIGLNKLNLNLKNFSRDIGSFRKPFGQLGEYMEKQAEMNLERRGKIMQSGGWPTLSESTKMYKSKYFPGKPMMVRTGKLRDSFKPINIGKDELGMFSNVNYAIYHQEGTSKLPQRILMKVYKQQVEDITGIMNDWLNKTLIGNFR